MGVNLLIDMTKCHEQGKYGYHAGSDGKFSVPLYISLFFDPKNGLNFFQLAA